MKFLSILKPLSFLPALALMYMIYSFSAQDAELSSSTSYKVSEAVVRVTNKVTARGWDDWQISEYANQINGPVRKCAHMLEYFLLAVAVSFPLYVYGVRGILLMLLAGGICVGYAFLDEYHQSQVMGRVASRRDIGVDSIGIFAGVILVRLLGWSGRMAITGPIYERKQKQKQRELDAREEELRRREEALRREQAVRRRERRQGRMASNDVRMYERQPDVYLRKQDSYGRQPETYGRKPEAYGRQPEVYGRQPERGAVSGDTRVFGPIEDVDDRTRVYRSQAEQQRYEKRLEQEYRARREAQQKANKVRLSEDSTSDQLSDDIPLSGLFRRK